MHDKNDATLMQICYKIDASPCYRVFREKGHELMKSKKVLIFCIMGLILWSAFSSKVNAEEDSNYPYLEDINYAHILDDSIPIRVEDARAIMEHTAEEEDSFISFIRLEREKAEIPFQHVVIPITTPYANYDYWSRYACYMISQVDVNFVGEADLLIHESFDSGSGGAWNLYRAVVWDKTAKEFFWYSSFPAWAVDLDYWWRG